MRILSISIRNLASLAGTQPPMLFGPGGLESGLVAITGATGSGKSTILDALCLALFGKTPRTAGAGSADSEGKQVGSLLSRGAKDAHAEVEFIDKLGRKLRARWSIDRARTGKIQQPRMMLWDLTQGEVRVLAAKMTDVRAEVEKALSMNFDQFIGVVVLSQGSFSSFLRGEKRVRSELLERLTGTDIYSKLSRASHRDAATRLEEYKALDRRIKDVRLLSREEREECEKALEDLEKRHAAQAELLKSERERKSSLDQLHGCHVDLKKASEHQAQCEEAHRAAEPERQKLSHAKKADGLRVPLDRQMQNDNAIESSCASVVDKERGRDAKKAASQAEREKSIESSRKLRGGWDQLRIRTAELERMSPATHARCSGIRTDLSHYSQQSLRGKEIAKEIPASEQQLAKAEAKEVTCKAAWDSAVDRVQAASEELESCSEALADFEKSHGRLEELARREERLRALGGLLGEHMAWKERVVRAKEGLASLREDHRRQEGRIPAAEKRVEDAQEAEASARIILEQVRRMADLAEKRHWLKEGEDCPLCEQEVRECPALLEESALQKAEESYATFKGRLEEVVSARDECKAKLESLVNQIELADSALVESAKTLRDKGQLVSDKLRECQLEPGMELDEASRAVAEMQAQIACLLKELEKLEKSRDDARNLHSNAAKEEASKSKIHDGAVQACKERHRDLHGLKTGLKQCTTTAGEYEVKIRTAMKSLGEECKVDVPEDLSDLEAWLDLLTEDHERWLEDSACVKDFSSEVEALVAEIEAACAPGTDLSPWADASMSAAELRECLRSTRGQWRRDLQAAAEHSAAVRILETEQGRLEGLRIEAKGLDKTVQAALSKAGIPDRETAVVWLLPKDEQVQLDERMNQIDLDLKLAIERIKVLQTRSGVLREKLGDEAPSDAELEDRCREATATVKDLDKQKTRLATELGGKREELKRDGVNRTKVKELQEELEDLERIYHRAQTLKDLIGHNKGEKFRDYAQALTLEQLVHYANHRLARFAPRYRLATREDLQLDVIDLQLADERRPAATLSGGESFLVSLALALGLADFKRGNSTIGSVFIDEGFGSLDRSSLESALCTLEQVQNELDAQVIVISHVGELDNRWSDHIHVRSLGHGRSWLVLPGGAMRPEKGAEAAIRDFEESIDADAIGSYLARQGCKQTRKKIAEALQIEDSGALKRTLEGDSRFQLDGRSWRLLEEDEVGEELLRGGEVGQSGGG